MSNRTLIIKLGALGDVVRTTPILRVLDGVVDWITNQECHPLLPDNRDLDREGISGLSIGTIFAPNQARVALKEEYDLVLSLDDDLIAAEIASLVKKKKLVGSFVGTDGKLSYTEDSSAWFDLGLISRFGKAKADALKLQNVRSWQEFLFEMAGKKFNGEECVIHAVPKNKLGPVKRIGVEKRAGSRWPMKQWNKYPELVQTLQNDGYKLMEFKQRDNIIDYVNDISLCDLVVTGDSLALHIALALKIPTVAIFICTSPEEIFGYNRLIKVVSPMLESVYYRKDYVMEAVESVSFEAVYGAVKAQIKKSDTKK